MTASSLEVLLPESREEAVQAFGDGSGVTVVAGGTIVLPELSYGRLRPGRALLLTRSGLAGIARNGSTTTIGAMTPVSELADLPAPLGPAAARVADVEIRAQATVGGNLCAVADEAPRGELQAALLALGATVRSAGSGGERDEPLEAFLDGQRDRLLLEVSFDEPAGGAFEQLRRAHTHAYATLSVAASRATDGTVRIAATGVGPYGRRLASAEARADDPTAAGEAALGDVTLTDDALASAWYRRRTLPVLVQRVLTRLEEVA
ncbi:MAG: FAD binding domain-containing protein [Gaiellaceae bacterium]